MVLAALYLTLWEMENKTFYFFFFCFAHDFTHFQWCPSHSPLWHGSFTFSGCYYSGCYSSPQCLPLSFLIFNFFWQYLLSSGETLLKLNFLPILTSINKKRRISFNFPPSAHSLLHIWLKHSPILFPFFSFSSLISCSDAKHFPAASTQGGFSALNILSVSHSSS